MVSGRPALVLAALLLAAPAPAASAGPRVLRVAAAANLQAALAEVAARYQAGHPGTEIQASYGASGTFFAQIRNGAPFDLFLAADSAYPAKVAETGLAAEAPFPYATGKLVLWVPSSTGLHPERDGLAILRDPSVRKIAVGDPAVAPYGAAAEEALRAAGLYEAVKNRLVLGRSVAQAAQFAESGNAQAAFLPLSLALAPPLAAEGRHFLVSPASHRPIAQAGVLLRAARDPALARDFAAFLRGPVGRALLEKHGYGPPAVQ